MCRVAGNNVQLDNARIGVCAPVKLLSSAKEKKTACLGLPHVFGGGAICQVEGHQRLKGTALRHGRHYSLPVLQCLQVFVL